MEFINDTAKAVAIATMIEGYRLGKIKCFTHFEEVMINRGLPVDPSKCLSYYEDIFYELQNVEPMEKDVKMYMEILRDLRERYRYHYLNDITEEESV